MTVRGLHAIVTAAILVGWTCEARAQAMPGTTTSTSSAPRSLSNRSTGARQGSMFGSGQVTTPTAATSEWMIKRSHAAGSFVGADSTDAAGFVGLQQALEARGRPLAAAAVGLIGQRNAQVNQPMATRRATELYHPQISVAFDVVHRSPEQISSSLAQEVATTPAIRSTSPIEVSVAGETATIRGEVASERDRALIEQMALFEPGISSVRNLLTLKAQPLPSPSLPSPGRSK